MIRVIPLSLIMCDPPPAGANATPQPATDEKSMATGFLVTSDQVRYPEILCRVASSLIGFAIPAVASVKASERILSERPDIEHLQF